MVEAYNHGHPRNHPRNVVRRLDRARNFPTNTCGASRHVEIMGRALIVGTPYPMLDEEPEHCGQSLLAVVESLWKARTEIDQLRARLGMPSRLEEAMATLSPNPSPDRKEP